jgi:hypothetical protein
MTRPGKDCMIRTFLTNVDNLESVYERQVAKFDPQARHLHLIHGAHVSFDE